LIKNIIVGGGHVNSKLEELAANIPATMYETYGMTETASHIALRCFNGTKKSEYFRVLDDVKIHQDHRNCLVIKAAHLHEKEIITNDSVEMNGSSEFRWLGRADSVINTGGIKVFPEQVEKKLEKIIHQPFFIFSVPDIILENKIILVIESDVFSKEKENELLKAIKQLISKFEAPKMIVYIPNFERSASNKILRLQTTRKIME
jgi:O-succinylbenzoic acid--CoA ligase